MTKSSVIRSAIRYPAQRAARLNSRKYSHPPARQKAAPYRRIWPPQAPWDQTNRAVVAATQNRRSSAAPSPHRRTRIRRMRNRS